jgi:hypothetical protein
MTGDDFFESLREDSKRQNAGVTHAEFVSGLKAGTIGFKCLFGEPFQLLIGARATMFTILVIMYKFAPFVLVPIWAYHERNWWLLFGILVSRLATRAAPWFLSGFEGVSFWSGKRYSFGALLVVLVIIFWISGGLHNYLTFFAPPSYFAPLEPIGRSISAFIRCSSASAHFTRGPGSHLADILPASYVTGAGVGTWGRAIVARAPTT